MGAAWLFFFAAWGRELLPMYSIGSLFSTGVFSAGRFVEAIALGELEGGNGLDLAAAE
jgi:hypothetical protein